ncbi:uncharacterized protein LOC117340587 [Pecten maximus]|uniref:uncharacterized protein LOC117340587 n=1 Tax=Pecten maximus TaxID=6579 RepID=UPI0014586E2A|nr:uncharacterized protein LOC117340587 [Pecten maximus]
MGAEKRKVHTISTVEYRIRSMKERDLPKVNALLDTEKWIMEKAYLDCAFKTDPRGFVVAESKNEEIIGFVGTLSLSKTLKAFGLWVVREDLRSTDVGSRLLEEINICPETKIGGFHFPHMQRTFELFTGPMSQSYTTWYNYGKIDKNVSLENQQIFQSKESAVILPLQHVSILDVIQYDTQIHKIPRESYITNWISHANSMTYVAMKDDAVCGYAVLRTQDTYTTIAPLYADTEYIANELFIKLTSDVPDKAIIGFTSPLENNAATKLSVRNRMMKKGMPMIMVFNQEPITVDIHRVYALATTSLGLC